MGYTTGPINVERGVFQGDCLSPLLFNLCFNTMIQTVKQKKMNCLGYIFDYALQSRHWLQFGMIKNVSQSVQFEPNLVICHKKIPAVENSMSFEYLGKKFNFELKINEAQEELEKRVIGYLTVIDKLPLHPKF